MRQIWDKLKENLKTAWKMIFFAKQLGRFHQKKEIEWTYGRYCKRIKAWKTRQIGWKPGKLEKTVEKISNILENRKQWENF